MEVLRASIALGSADRASGRNREYSQASSASQARSAFPFGLLSVIVCLVAATGWSQDLILPTNSIEDGIVFKPWSDFFVHATIVPRSLGAQTLFKLVITSGRAFPQSSTTTRVTPSPHVWRKSGICPAYATVVGFWAPFGSFLTGLASYALGRAIWSQGAGLAALMATSLIPDACVVERRSPYLRLFLAPTGCSCRCICCRDCWNRADTYRTRSERRAACLDSGRRGSRCAGGFFQSSDFRGGISAAAFLCCCGLAAAETLAMARARRLCRWLD